MYYAGNLNFATKNDALKMVKAIQDEEINLDYLDYLSEADICQNVCDECFIYIDGESYIEDDLHKMADYAKNHNIEMCFSIEYHDDDCYGSYDFNDGQFESLNSIECSIRNANSEDLIIELERRGYSVSSLNN